MAKINQSIKIVSSSIVELSSMSRPSRQAIYDIISRHYSDVEVVLVDSQADLEELADSRPDIVFLGMKFIPKNPRLGINDPDKIWLSQYLEDRGITCTGSTSEAHRLELNKQLAKHSIIDSGLSTSPYFVVDHKTLQLPSQINLEYPLFVKPANRGGGLGIDSQSVVRNRQQLADKVKQIADQYKSDSLVEELLPGREFSVAILRQPQTMQYRAMPIELIVDADDSGVAMLAGDVKSDNNEQISTIEDTDLRAAVSRLAIESFKSLGGRDYGRIDIRLDRQGRPTFLEANLIPSLIRGYGSFPKACQINLGLEHTDMIIKIVDLAIARRDVRRQSVFSAASIGPASELPVY